MNINNYDDLFRHYGHQIVVVTYGDKTTDIDKHVNVSLECETCNEVLIDFNKEEHYCENCVKRFQDEDVKIQWPDIPGLGERCEPGGEVPSGECPNCGALVYKFNFNKN